MGSLLVLAPQFDTEGKSDASGAFKPEARAFADLHHGRLALVNNNQPLGDRRSQAVALINQHVQQYGMLDTFACFCHGWQSGIQLGFRVGHADLLARTLTQQRARVTTPLIVALYACDTARDADEDRIDDMTESVGGVGGFADVLCTALQNLGTRARVFAHATLGHTSENPYLRVFSTDDGVPGGAWVIDPQNALWPRWKRALAQTDLRLRVPFMTPSEILSELSAVA